MLSLKSYRNARLVCDTLLPDVYYTRLNVYKRHCTYDTFPFTRKQCTNQHSVYLEIDLSTWRTTGIRHLGPVVIPKC